MAESKNPAFFQMRYQPQYRTTRMYPSPHMDLRRIVPLETPVCEPYPPISSRLELPQPPDNLGNEQAHPQPRCLDGFTH